MRIEAAFPLRFWSNLGSASTLRQRMEENLFSAGLSAERFPALYPRRLGSRASDGGDDLQRSSIDGADYPVSGYGSYRAHTQKLMLREAVRRRADAVLILDDNVAFHPNFPALVEAVELPQDWEIFFLGCVHSKPPVWAGIRTVRVKRGWGDFAFAVRHTAYRKLIRLLDSAGSNFALPGDSPRLAEFLASVPTYACYPNLIWKHESGNAKSFGKHSMFTSDGRQRRNAGSVCGLLAQVCSEPSEAPQLPEGERATASIPPRRMIGNSGDLRIGLLFLTRGDVNHPAIWGEFVREMPDCVKVLSHPKYPRLANEGFLKGSVIRKRYETQWGDISLVRASRELLLEGLKDRALTHFALLSESCVPVLPLSEIVRRLRHDPRSRFSSKTISQAGSRHASRIGAAPEVPLGCWRFTPQWWLMDRTTATFAAGQDYTGLFERMYVPDEAYFATVLSMQGYPLDGEVAGKDVTWTWWEKDAGSPTAWTELPFEKLVEIVDSGAFFARKFPAGGDIGTFGLHRPAITSPAG